MPLSDVPDYSLLYQFHVQGWNTLLDTDHILIPMTDLQIFAIQKNGLSRYVTELAAVVNDLLNVKGSPMFFKLSSRSAKDVETTFKDPETGVQHYKLNTDKDNVSPVNCFGDIVQQIRTSERLKEDMTNHINRTQDQSEEKLYLVLQPLIKNIRSEYRVFVAGNVVVGCCSFTDVTSCSLPDGFDYDIIRKLNTKFRNYCVDIHTRTNDSKVYVTEVNELSFYTDTMDFDFNELILRSVLYNSHFGHIPHYNSLREQLDSVVVRLTSTSV
jgi:hypothetical protein